MRFRRSSSIATVVRATHKSLWLTHQDVKRAGRMKTAAASGFRPQHLANLFAELRRLLVAGVVTACCTAISRTSSSVPAMVTLHFFSLGKRRQSAALRSFLAMDPSL